MYIQKENQVYFEDMKVNKLNPFLNILSQMNSEEMEKYCLPFINTESSKVIKSLRTSSKSNDVFVNFLSKSRPKDIKTKLKQISEVLTESNFAKLEERYKCGYQPYLLQRCIEANIKATRFVKEEKMEEDMLISKEIEELQARQRKVRKYLNKTDKILNKTEVKFFINNEMMNKVVAPLMSEVNKQYD